MKTSYPKRRAAQSRAAILNAAEKCFLEAGYTVSMDVILEEADVSRATLFSHFGTKEALYRAVIAAISDRELLPIFQILEEPSDSREEYATVLRKFAIAFANGILLPNRVALHRLSVSETRRFPELSSSHYVRGMGRILPVVSKYLRKGIAARYIRKAHAGLLSEQFLLSCLGYRQYRALLGLTSSPWPTEAYVDTSLEGLLGVARDLNPTPERCYTESFSAL